MKRSRSHKRIAVIGDIGGHAQQLRLELTRLGANGEGRLPDDLLVIQVGDLIHRGPASDDVVALVDGYLHAQPGQWIQLIGNHEVNYLGLPVFRWPEELSRRRIRMLKRWWSNGDVRVATAVDTDHESYLVTHAGVTAQFWSTTLGGPVTAADAAHRLNGLAHADADAVFRPGVLLSGTIAQDAGPLWADTATELLPGWADRQLPFSQIHGHNSITVWRGDHAARPRAAVEALVTVDADAKHEFVHLAGGRLIGIDPDHRETPTVPWRALELRGTVTAC